jgi:hypothetical protein
MNAAADTRYMQGLLNIWRYLHDYIGSAMFARPAWLPARARVELAYGP